MAESGKKLVAIADYFFSVDAEQSRLFLESEGISAFVDGTNSGETLSLGSAHKIRLSVSSENVERAKELLQEIESEHRSGVDGAQQWICMHCKQWNEPAFAICWSCQEERSADSIVRDAKELPKKPVMIFDEEESGSAIGESTERGARPRDAKPKQESLAAVIDRAYRASIIGWLLCPPPLLPPLVHFYSMYLLLRAAFNPEPLDRRSSTRYMYAMLLNLAAAVVFGCLLSVAGRMGR